LGFDPLLSHPKDELGETRLLLKQEKQINKNTHAEKPDQTKIVEVDALGRSGPRVKFTSKWKMFGSALMTTYVCEHLNIPLPGGVKFMNLLSHLDDLKPYVGVVHFHHFIPQVNTNNNNFITFPFSIATNSFSAASLLHDFH
jgi:hypothetical protein